MDNFIPHTSKESKKVPYFEEARTADGWQGHTTTKTEKRLKAEIGEAISRLGGMVIGFEEGMFGERPGVRILYTLEVEGQFSKGRLDIAALPVKSYRSQGRKKKLEQSYRMALYMVVMALNGTWFLQQLSPGYAPLMPWLIGKGDKTISQLWAESAMMSMLLPPPTDEFTEGEVVE